MPAVTATLKMREHSSHTSPSRFISSSTGSLSQAVTTMTEVTLGKISR
jgi:hypothetical protein